MKLTVSGVDKIIKRVQSMQSTLGTRCRELLEKLSQAGYEIAAYRFQSAQYDGTNDVQVSLSWEGDNKVSILANGSAVLFIEFGTGITYSEQHPLAAEMGAIRGEYGKGKGKQSSWGYYGEPGTNGKVRKETPKGTLIITQGNPPARAMYDAGKEMKNQVATIAKEVFKK